MNLQQDFITRLETVLAQDDKLCENKSIACYILWSDVDGEAYVGTTRNFDRRLVEHEEGDTKVTKRWKLVKVLGKIYTRRSVATIVENFVTSYVAKEFPELDVYGGDCCVPESPKLSY